MDKFDAAREFIREAEAGDVDRLKQLGTMAHEKARQLAASQWLKGDIVEFEHRGFRIRGKVKTVNQKTLTLTHCVGVSPDGRKRAVPQGYRVGHTMAQRSDELFNPVETGADGPFRPRG